MASMSLSLPPHDWMTVDTAEGESARDSANSGHAEMDTTTTAIAEPLRPLPASAPLPPSAPSPASAPAAATAAATAASTPPAVFLRHMQHSLDVARQRRQVAFDHQAHADEVSRHTWALLKDEAGPCHCSKDLRPVFHSGRTLKTASRARTPSTNGASAAAATATMCAPMPARPADQPCFDLASGSLSIEAIQAYLTASPASDMWCISVQLRNTSDQRSFERLTLALSHDARDAPRSPAFALACQTHDVQLQPLESVCLAIKLHTSSLPSAMQEIPLVLKLSWFESRQWISQHFLARLRLPRWADTHEHALIFNPTAFYAATSLSHPLISVLDQLHRVDLVLSFKSKAQEKSMSDAPVEPLGGVLTRLLKEKLSFVQADPAALDLASSNINVMARWLLRRRQAELDEFFLRPNQSSGAEAVMVHATIAPTFTVFGPSPTGLLRFFHVLESRLSVDGVGLHMDLASSQAATTQAQLDSLQRVTDSSLVALKQHMPRLVERPAHATAASTSVSAQQCLAFLHQQLTAQTTEEAGPKTTS